MAVIPKYISDSPVTPAVSNAHIDPQTAAAPYQAAAQSTGHLMNIFQHEMGAWQGMLHRKELEQKAAALKNQKVQDSLYTAQAMGTASLAAADLTRKAVAGADGVTNTAALADQEFQKMADSILANAPSDEARVGITKRLIGLRSHLYNKASNESIKMNNQVNMDKLEGMLAQYESHATSNPMDAEEVKAQASDVFQAMNELGLPASHRQQIMNKFNTRIDFRAAKTMAEQDPFEVQKKIEEGAFNHLGSANVRSILSTVKASTGAMTRQAKLALSDVEKRVMSGMALPDDFEARANLAAKVGLEDDLKDVVNLVEVGKMVADSKLSDLAGVASELKAASASGELDMDPKKFKKLIKYVDTNIAAMKNDPFAYAANRGKFNPFPTKTDFTSFDPQEVQQRNYRALQVQEAYGVASPSLSKEEIHAAASQLETAPGPEKMKILANLAQLGDTTIESIAKTMSKKDGGIAQAIRMHSIDPSVSEKILGGRELLANKQGSSSHREMQEAMETEMQSLVVDDPALRSEYMKAAHSVHAYETARGNPVSAAEALKSANNIMDVDRNGLFTGRYRTVAPGPNMKTGDLDKLVDNNLKSVQGWKEYGTGLPARTENGKALFINRMSPSDFDYVYARGGKYKVMYEGHPVLDESGRDLTIDLQRLYKDTQPK